MANLAAMDRDAQKPKIVASPKIAASPESIRNAIKVTICYRSLSNNIVSKDVAISQEATIKELAEYLQDLMNEAFPSPLRAVWQTWWPTRQGGRFEWAFQKSDELKGDNRVYAAMIRYKTSMFEINPNGYLATL